MHVQCSLRQRDKIIVIRRITHLVNVDISFVLTSVSDIHVHLQNFFSISVLLGIIQK
jgi:hypothetical protein